MTTTRERESRSLQLWPSGRTLHVTGDSYGPTLRVRDDYKGKWRKPTEEDRRAIRIQEAALRYQANEIYCCDSCLVDDMLKAAGGGELPSEMAKEWDYENVQNVYADPSDWDVEKCREWLDENGHDVSGRTIDPWSMSREEMIEALESASIECKPHEDDETLRTAVIENINDETIDGLKEWRDAVSENASEHAAEIYEWYRVTEYFGKELASIGECVLDNAYGTWWGRCCTGQNNIMDGVLQQVAAKHVE